MTSSAPDTIAYYTVVNDDRTGWTGGLLILSAGGRPLEFQCTLPVRPTRAHEILYGPTLRGHLVAEVIGPLLLKKARTPIAMLCIDQPEAMSLDTLANFPVALVDEAAEPNEGPISAETIAESESVEFCETRLWVPVEQSALVTELVDWFVDLPDAVEPFSRIRDAIKEAHSQIARQKPAEAA